MKRALCILILSASLCRAEVIFKTLPFPEAQREAVSQHKSIMMDFYTDWCYWCKVMDGKTFSDAAVGTFANTKFIPLRVDAEKGEGVALAEKFGIHGYPTVLFIDDQGHELYRIVGWESPEKFMRSMSIAAMGSVSQLEENLLSHPDDPQVLYALAQKYASIGDTEKAMNDYRRVVSLDEGNHMQLAEHAALAVAQAEAKNGNIAPLEAFVRDYPNAHSVKDVGYELALNFLKAGNGAKSQRYFDMAMDAGPENAELLNGFAWACAQHKLILPRALQYARKAVALASGPTQQATYLDTQAEVFNSQGNRADAAKCERDAIALLVGDGRNERLLSELQKRLSGFAQ